METPSTTTRKTRHIPSRSGSGARQVLQAQARRKNRRRPNTRLKATRHPWAARLHAARTAGFVVEQVGDDAVFYRCYACGAGGGIAGQFTGSDDDYEAQEHFESELRHHETRECVAVTR